MPVRIKERAIAPMRRNECRNVPSARHCWRCDSSPYNYHTRIHHATLYYASDRPSAAFSDSSPHQRTPRRTGDRIGNRRYRICEPDRKPDSDHAPVPRCRHPCEHPAASLQPGVGCSVVQCPGKRGPKFSEQSQKGSRRSQRTQERQQRWAQSRLRTRAGRPSRMWY